MTPREEALARSVDTTLTEHDAQTNDADHMLDNCVQQVQRVNLAGVRSSEERVGATPAIDEPNVGKVRSTKLLYERQLREVWTRLWPRMMDRGR